MDETRTLSDVQGRADRLAGDLGRSLAELNGSSDWQALADVLREAASAAESLSAAAAHVAREEQT